MWGNFFEKQSKEWNCWALFLLNSVYKYFSPVSGVVVPNPWSITSSHSNDHVSTVHGVELTLGCVWRHTFALDLWLSFSFLASGFRLGLSCILLGLGFTWKIGVSTRFNKFWNFSKQTKMSNKTAWVKELPFFRTKKDLQCNWKNVPKCYASNILSLNFCHSILLTPLKQFWHMFRPGPFLLQVAQHKPQFFFVFF